MAWSRIKTGRKRSLQQYTLEFCNRFSATATNIVKYKHQEPQHKFH